MYNKLLILQMTAPLNALSGQISRFLSAENPAYTSRDRYENLLAQRTSRQRCGERDTILDLPETPQPD